MKILLSLLVITFLSVPVMAESVDGKAVLCSDVHKGLFFKGDNIVRIFRIYGGMGLGVRLISGGGAKSNTMAS